MSDISQGSEFGGNTNHLGIQPFPHRPNETERLRTVYLTGDELEGEDGNYLPRQGDREAFNGLLTEEEQRKIREEEGDFVKGEVWEEMQE